MRTLREQPRLAVAKTLAAVCLVAVGLLVGAGLRSDGGRSHSAEVRLVSAQRSISARGADLRDAQARIDATESELRRAKGRLAAIERVNRRLRDDLRKPTRPRRHERKQ